MLIYAQSPGKNPRRVLRGRSFFISTTKQLCLAKTLKLNIMPLKYFFRTETIPTPPCRSRGVQIFSCFSHLDNLNRKVSPPQPHGPSITQVASISSRRPVSFDNIKRAWRHREMKGDFLRLPARI